MNLLIIYIGLNLIMAAIDFVFGITRGRSVGRAVYLFLFHCVLGIPATFAVFAHHFMLAYAASYNRRNHGIVEHQKKS